MLGERRERSGRVAAPLVGEHGWGEDAVHPDGPLGADTLFAVKHLGGTMLMLTPVSSLGLKLPLSEKKETETANILAEWHCLANTCIQMLTVGLKNRPEQYVCKLRPVQKFSSAIYLERCTLEALYSEFKVSQEERPGVYQVDPVHGHQDDTVPTLEASG